MNEIKQNIVGYYESCLNVMDNHAEILLSNPEISERDIQHINSLRDLFISEIRRIERLNLENLNKYQQNNQEDDKIDSFDNLINITFQKKFCFFIPNDPNRGHLFKSNRFGVLVILNQFIPVDIIENLIELSNRNTCLNDMNHLVDDFDDLIKIFIIYELISSKTNESIIDLSSVENNVLHSLEIKSTKIDSDSLDWLDSILNMQKLETLTFGFQNLNLKTIDKKLFSKFEHLKWLQLESAVLNQIQRENFSALINLKRLTFQIKIAKIDRNGFDGLNHLETLEFCSSDLTKLAQFELNHLEKLHKLSIIYHSIDCIEEDSFKLSALKILRLNSNKISKIKSGAFKSLKNLEELYLEDQLPKLELDSNSLIGLNNLKILSLQKNLFIKFDSNLFNDLEQLEYLSLRQTIRYNSIEFVDYKLLNSLKKLQFLDLSINENIQIDFEKLELNNLKFLLVKSKTLPNLLKVSLQGLKVFGLESFSTADIDNFSKLEYLNLGFKSFNKSWKSISSYFFDNFENLMFIKIKWFESNQENKSKLQNYMDAITSSIKSKDNCFSKEMENNITNRIDHIKSEDSSTIQVSKFMNENEFFEKYLNISDVTRKCVMKNFHHIHYN